MSRLIRRAKQAERELTESQARCRVLIEHASEAIIIFDATNNRICDANSGAQGLFKLAREDLLRLSITDLSPDTQPGGRPSAGLMCQMVEAAMAGQVPAFEWVHLAGDNELVPCRMRLVRLPARDRVLICASFTDLGAQETDSARARIEGEAARAHHLQWVTDTALSHMALGKLLPELCMRLRDVMKADNAAILLAEGAGELVVRGSSGFEPVGTRVPPGVGFAGRVVARGGPVELRGNELAVVHTPSLRDLGCLIGVPLLVEERVVGVVHVGFYADRQVWAEELTLLQLAADRVALAIENARTYERERSTAETLQQTLLPESLPSIPRFELAASYQPVGAGYDVGGDFYDAFAAGQSRWVFVIGDVCGKGPKAAAVTAHARYTLRSEALHDSTPSTMLYRLNEALLSHRSDQRFLTVACLMLELADSTPQLTVAVAGHPLPVLVHSDGGTHELGACGPLVGMWEDVEYQDSQTALRPGDALVCYTDGLLDAYAPGRFVDPGEVAQALSVSRTLDIQEMVTQLDRLLLQSEPDTPRDDVAILGLRFCPGKTNSGADHAQGQGQTLESV